MSSQHTFELLNETKTTLGFGTLALSKELGVDIGIEKWNSKIVIPSKYNKSISNEIPSEISQSKQSKNIIEYLQNVLSKNNDKCCYYLIPSYWFIDDIELPKPKETNKCNKRSLNETKECEIQENSRCKRRKLNGAIEDELDKFPKLTIPDPPQFTLDDESSQKDEQTQLPQPTKVTKVTKQTKQSKQTKPPHSTDITILQGINAKCICKNTLNPMTTADAARLMKVDGFECDSCNTSLNVNDDTFIFHCPSNNEKEEHEDGYDLCVDCAMKQKENTNTNQSQSINKNTKNINNASFTPHNGAITISVPQIGYRAHCEGDDFSSTLNSMPSLIPDDDDDHHNHNVNNHSRYLPNIYRIPYGVPNHYPNLPISHYTVQDTIN